jgi:oxygen-independent coproporphyrinogen-3 oxidase
MLSIDNFKLFLRGLSKIYDTYNIMSEFEPSIEATFNTIKEDYLEEIVLSGFQRISFGLQTNNKKLLNDLNRENSTLRHTENTINLCRNKGIKKINIDLMYGLPNLTTKDIINSIDIIKYLMPEHIALYEFRTNILHLSENFNKIELYRQYELFFNGLIKLGYKGNFGQNTFSLYDDFGLSSYLKNRTINNMSYKGFGISAQSKSETGISYNIGKNKESFDICCKNKTFYEVDTYFLPKDELLSKYIAISGYYGFFYISTANKIINDNFLEIFNKEIEFLINQKYIEIKNDKINITRNGFLYYGAILALFYSTNTKNKLIK